MSNISIKVKILINIICIVLGVLILYSVSYAKYKSSETNGEVIANTALFNTVLLGSLTNTDLSELKYISATNNKLGQKINTNLSLTASNEIQSNSLSAGLKPGDTRTIPFVVTNGTTLTTNLETGEIKNVAETDILYKITIASTLNIPLEYTLKDISTNSVYSLKTVGSSFNEEVGGYIVELIVDNDAGMIEKGAFIDGKRLLKYEEGSITVHRYELQVHWPTTGQELYTAAYNSGQNEIYVKTTEYDNKSIKSKEFMKEMDNIEIRIDVESYVIDGKNGTLNKPIEIVSLSNYFELENTNFLDYTDVVEDLQIENWYAEKKVRYNSLGDTDEALSSDEITSLNENAHLSIPTNSTVYSYKFKIRNCDKINVDYTSIETTDDTEIGGKYVLSGEFGSFENSHLALGLICPDSVVGEDKITGFKYYLGEDINNDGLVDNYYYAKINDGYSADTPVITNSVWEQDSTRDNKMHYKDDNAYAFTTFHLIDETGNADRSVQMNMASFNGSEADEHTYTLYILDSELGYNYGESTDEYIIYVYD